MLDDSRARRVGEQLSLRLIGTLGLLRSAKQPGLIEALRPQIEALQASTNLKLSNHLTAGLERVKSRRGCVLTTRRYY